MINCLPRGHKFKAPSPEKGGYVLAHDLRTGDRIDADTFKEYGGQPKPQVGMTMPTWLYQALQAEAERLQGKIVSSPPPQAPQEGN